MKQYNTSEEKQLYVVGLLSNLQIIYTSVEEVLLRLVSECKLILYKTRNKGNGSSENNEVCMNQKLLFPKQSELIST
jgi:hypothetical protein